MKRNNLLLYLGIFAISFIAAFVFLLSFMNCIAKFIDVKTVVSWRVTVGTSILFSIVNTVFSAIKIHSGSDNPVSFWEKTNRAKLSLSYLILLLFFGAVTNTVVWSSDEIKEMLSLEWMIFGLSLTIFLVWNVLIVDYLKKKQPTPPKKTDYEKMCDYLERKQSLYIEVEETFSTVIMLSINLFLLLVSSTFVYISHKPEAIFTQNTVCCTFFFTSNTIVSLFFDALKPFKKERDSLKRENQVTKKEIDAAQAGMIIHLLFTEGVKKIQQEPEMSDEEKKHLTHRYVEALKEALLEFAEEKSKGVNSNQVIKKAELSSDWIEDYS